MGDNYNVEGWGHGNIKLQFVVHVQQEICLLKDKLYVPNLHYSLLSVETLCANGVNIIFSSNKVYIVQSRKIIAAVLKLDSLYILQATKTELALHASLNT